MSKPIRPAKWARQCDALAGDKLRAIAEPGRRLAAALTVAAPFLTIAIDAAGELSERALGRRFPLAACLTAITDLITRAGGQNAPPDDQAPDRGKLQ